MNQVKNMSLNERHGDVNEHNDDQPGMDAIVPRWRLMMIKQSIEGASVDERSC